MARDVREFGVDPTGGPVHNDFAFIALTIVFFVLAGLLTVACDHIIGPDPADVTASATSAEERLRRHELRQHPRPHPRGPADRVPRVRPRFPEKL